MDKETISDEQLRRSAISSRSGYKSKLTRVKKVIAKYETDQSLLSLATALAEIEHNLNLLPGLSTKLENVQEDIIRLTVNEDDRQAEADDLKTMLDEIEESVSRLAQLRVKAKADGANTDSVSGMFQFLSNRMDEQP